MNERREEEGEEGGGREPLGKGGGLSRQVLVPWEWPTRGCQRRGSWLPLQPPTAP